MGTSEEIMAGTFAGLCDKTDTYLKSPHICPFLLVIGEYHKKGVCLAHSSEGLRAKQQRRLAVVRPSWLRMCAKVHAEGRGHAWKQAATGRPRSQGPIHGPHRALTVIQGPLTRSTFKCSPTSRHPHTGDQVPNS